MQQPASPPVKNPSAEINVISSDWLRLSFNEVWSTPTTRNIVFQLANHAISPAISYNTVTDTALTYVKVPGSTVSNYYLVPGLVNTATTGTQPLYIKFELNPVSFDVSVWNAVDASQMPDAGPLQSYRFRYIVIAKTTFASLNINWSNYYVVAQALNLSL